MASIEEESDQNSGNVGDKTTINDSKYDRNRVAFVLKLIVIITSAIFVLYSAIQLLKFYFDYSTSLSVHYEYNDWNEFPSFTICLPAIVDRHKLILKYPDLEIKLNQTLSEQQRNDILTEYLDKTLDSMTWKELSITEEETFNCSLNYWPSSWSESHKYKINRSVSVNCRDVVKPIEHFANNKGKCFTYLSELQSGGNFVGMYLISITSN